MFCDCSGVYKILKLINLTSYSCSKNFLGYSNYEDSFSSANLEKFAENFKNHFLWT